MLVDAHYRAVLFDFFGTLTQAVRRGPYHNHIARALGCDPGDFVTVLNHSFLDRSQGAYGTAVETLRWVCAQLDVHPTTADLRAACAARVAAVRADTRLRADAVLALRSLRRRGLRLAVVSDCGHELPAFLPSLPVAPLIDAAIFSVEVGRCKPHPAMYLTACSWLDVSPQECLYVGDGGSRELSGAASVGMAAVRLSAPDLDGHLSFRAEADWGGPVVDTLSAVTSLVDRVPAPV